MQTTTETAGTLDDPQAQQHFLEGLLEGYRFFIAQTPEDVAQALEIRRRVYHDEVGYDVAIPDEYDHRSWFLLAEEVATGKRVGTIRVTPRSEGPLEAEEYFRLPLPLQCRVALEVSRFAILPGYRKGKTFLPVVSLGLFNLTRCFADAMGFQYLVICSKSERLWTYEWLRFKRTGLVARYEKLQGALHELLSLDLNRTEELLVGHPMRVFIDGTVLPEVHLPETTAELGLLPGTALAAVGA
jgi:hypothetical protein